jgi:hypothetical protein
MINYNQLVVPLTYAGMQMEWDSENFKLVYATLCKVQDSRFFLDRHFEINPAENWYGI